MYRAAADEQEESETNSRGFFDPFMGIFIHLKEAHQATNWFWRLVWLSLSIGLTYMCVFDFYTTLATFLSYPVRTVIKEERHRQLPLPRVTICDFNWLERDLFRSHFPNDTHPWIYSHFLGKWSGTGETEMKQFESAYLNWSNGKAFDLLEFLNNYSYSPGKKPLILVYRVGDRTTDCDEDTCKSFFSHGRVCRIINARSFQKSAGGAGFTNSLIIQWEHYKTSSCDPNIHSFMDCSTEVHLTNPAEDHALSERPLTVELGYTVFLKVWQKRRILLPPPHGNCGTKELKYFNNYTRSLCLREQYLQRAIQRCGCADPRMLFHKHAHFQAPQCNSIELWKCINPFFWDQLESADYENCPDACIQQTTFEVHQSR